MNGTWPLLSFSVNRRRWSGSEVAGGAIPCDSNSAMWA